ncbi:hypothetical protein [Mycolicibacterium lutetiense]|uniref:hypothetical protein n=1 Tax=Mycolicibacterium lutetiense TaxID=1641992 RepID=UPI001AE9F2A6|nr:hypothetical protein [Mycolicibacterium lutetiense]
MTTTVTVTVTPRHEAAQAPIELPRGSILDTRAVNDYSGAWEDMWQVPHAGPDAMSTDAIIKFLQAELPGGRPFDIPGSNLQWCRGDKDYWSWQKPKGSGPSNEPNVVDRLFVQVYAGQYIRIQRDQNRPLDCDGDGKPDE